MKLRLLRLAMVSFLGIMASAAQFNVAAQTYQWDIPQWVPVPVVPDDNPMTDKKVELGRHLFYDQRLSADQTMSCATCHHQDKAFTDGRRFAKGISGQSAIRNAMSLTNVAYLPVLTWSNPMLTSMEAQALIPLFGEHPVEMGMAGKEALLFERLKTEPVYQRLFRDAFPKEAQGGETQLYSLSTVTKALASFQRRLLSFDSPYDRFRYGGDQAALSPQAKRGEALFFGEKMECYHCHGGLNFTDNIKHARLPFPELGFHNTGLYNVDGKGAYPTGQTGIEEFTGAASDMGKFRTPTLRNIAKTAPYMHDGSVPDLATVIRTHYARGGRAGGQPSGPSPKRSELLVGFQVNEQEVQDLIAFLHALTDEGFLQDERLSDPWKR
ncbi:MbnH family di-heme enzyme [Zwartia sp.]|uniref:MbnH family di-heme enzyme n=1 Tax=Zwartia sp. TaxID=2978004 RepID=UPI003BB187D4